MSRSTAPRRQEPPPAEPRDFVLMPGEPPGHPSGGAPPPERRAVPAPRPAGEPEPGMAGAGAGLLAGGEFALLGLLALVGAFFASASASPGDYAAGMILALASIALAFLRLKARLDGTAGGWSSALLVDDWANLTLVIIVFVLLGLAGLFLAAAYEYGGLHTAGLALFVASGIAVFLNLKRVFDNYERDTSDRGG
jgi:hypothetical protein